MIFTLDSLDDPRLEPYRRLKERELARDGRRFIAEGQHLVRRLLDSDFPAESVLLSVSVRRTASAIDGIGGARWEHGRSS